MGPHRARISCLDTDDPRLDDDPALACGATACGHRSLRIAAARASAREDGSPVRPLGADFFRDLSDALDVADGLAAAAVCDPAEPDPELLVGVGHQTLPLHGGRTCERI